MFEIIILAMIAAFLGLRLYSVLGRRAEHEEEIVPGAYDRADELKRVPPAATPVTDAPRIEKPMTGFTPAVEAALRDIAAADRRFDLFGFLEGARGAYQMALEAYWRGDKEELAQLCDADVLESFNAAIAEREAAGHKLDNRLIRIEDVTVHSAMLDGHTARIALRFVSDIAAVTRDAEGQLIAGSLDDAVESCDVWTFSRDVRSTAPAWLIDETDEG